MGVKRQQRAAPTRQGAPTATSAQRTFATFLISTPCAFRGEFESDKLSIAQVIKNIGDQRHFAEAGPFERHFYALHVQIHVHSPVVRYELDHELIVAVLSLIYGKSIQSHGQIWSSMGIWSLPDMLTIAPNDNYRLPCFGGDRTDWPSVSSSWESLADFRALLPLMTHSAEDPIFRATRSYAEALRLLAIDIEIAYFRLIQALESAAGAAKYSDEERFGHDQQLLSHVNWLESDLGNRGRATAKFLKDRLYQVKRGVSLWVRDHIGDNFFRSGKDTLQRSDLDTAISAAYALRSGYVHTGLRFGRWVSPFGDPTGSNETVKVIPGLSEPGLEKILSAAPSFVGLERIVRACLFGAIESKTQ